jgi:hypothetical protein
MLKYRRIRVYQPIISENWKFNKGLRVTIGNEKVNLLPLKNDIEYQYKIINDEFKLLEAINTLNSKGVTIYILYHYSSN